MNSQRSDAMLMEVLQEQKTVTRFLDAVFGFLRRNTDFYHTKSKDDEKIGFEHNIREQLVHGAMLRYDPQSQKNNKFAVPADSSSSSIQVSTNGQVGEATKKALKKDQPQLQVETLGFISSEYKNGAKFEHYCWSQSLKDVELHVLVPAELNKAKHFKVQINANSISVSTKETPERIIVNGELDGRIKHTESVWTLDKGRLLISCDKAKEQWWERFYVNENSIDIKKLNCERYLDELPDESQAQIEKLRVQQMAADQQQQKVIEGAKSKKEIDYRETLRLAWDVEGSPFKGQPYDPSLVRFS